MILVVSEGPVPETLHSDREVRTVEEPGMAGDLLEANSVDAVVLRSVGPSAFMMVEDLRAGSYGDHRVPVVIAAEPPPEALDLLAFDSVCPPEDTACLENAIAVAYAVADYQEALASFYSACQDRADRGVTDPLEESRRLQELREAADEQLDDLLDDTQTVADLLWTGDRAPDFGFGSG